MPFYDQILIVLKNLCKKIYKQVDKNLNFAAISPKSIGSAQIFVHF